MSLSKCTAYICQLAYSKVRESQIHFRMGAGRLDDNVFRGSGRKNSWRAALNRGIILLQLNVE